MGVLDNSRRGQLEGVIAGRVGLPLANQHETEQHPRARLTWLSVTGLILATLALVAVGLMPRWVIAQGSGGQTDVVITVTPYTCGPPTDFSVTWITDQHIDLEWNLGVDAAETIIIGRLGRYPISLADGYIVYQGTGTDTSDTVIDLDQMGTGWYYRAWSLNTDGLSSQRWAQGFVEGIGMTLIAQVLLLGIIVGLAFWKRDMFLYMMAGPAVMAFGTTWFSTNAVIAIVIMVIGGYCLALAILKLVRR